MAAYGALILTLLFGLAMGYSFGIKNPLDFSVFVVNAGAFLLAAFPNRDKWSLYEYVVNRNQNHKTKNG